MMKSRENNISEEIQQTSSISECCSVPESQIKNLNLEPQIDEHFRVNQQTASNTTVQNNDHPFELEKELQKLLVVFHLLGTTEKSQNVASSAFILHGRLA